MKKPDFIGIGGHKCASTWFAENLNLQKGISISSPKEIHYFTRNYRKGHEWYESHFKDKCISGEFSSDYMTNIEALRKINNQYPNAKLIAVIRKPSKRIISHLRHLHRQGYMREKKTFKIEDFNEIINKFPEVESYSKYEECIKWLIENKGKEKFHCEVYEDFKKNNKESLERVIRFIDPGFDAGQLKLMGVISKSITPRYQWIENLRVKLHDMFYEYAPFMIDLIKRSGAAELLRSMNEGKSLQINKELSDFLIREYDSNYFLITEMVKKCR